MTNRVFDPVPWTIGIELDNKPASRGWDRTRVSDFLAWENFYSGEVGKLKWIEWRALPTGFDGAKYEIAGRLGDEMDWV
jgi:hypothetical protein